MECGNVVLPEERRSVAFHQTIELAGGERTGDDQIQRGVVRAKLPKSSVPRRGQRRLWRRCCRTTQWRMVAGRICLATRMARSRSDMQADDYCFTAMKPAKLYH